MAIARLGAVTGFDRDRAVVLAFGALVAAPLLLFVAYPLWRILSLSFHTGDGIGLANYVRYFGTARRRERACRRARTRIGRGCAGS